MGNDDFAEEEPAKFRDFDHMPVALPRDFSLQAVDERTYNVASFLDTFWGIHPSILLNSPGWNLLPFVSLAMLFLHPFEKPFVMSPGTPRVALIGSQNPHIHY